ncbi:MAG: SEC-C domain-containing protein [Deltaproteobacteria bacterium]|nr:SEC-C domain-containing protein [Deltaproteobacteria bacterium]
MKKLGRNEPCPCGSGKKFKHCHMGKDDDIDLTGMGEISSEMSARITRLPTVCYGRSKEMLDALDIRELTGSSTGVRFIDLMAYHGLDMSGGRPNHKGKDAQGGVIVNALKTSKSDPDNIYIAISLKIEDSQLVHELAHVLEYLAGPQLTPGIATPFDLDLGIPVEHLTHSQEFGYWLDYLANKFNVLFDADNAIISYLYRKGMLIKSADIESRNRVALKSKSEQILKFLSDNSTEIDAMIRELQGYIGSRVKKD